MNRTMRILPAILAMVLVVGMTGCEWEYAGSGFDTSSGAGIDFNFTGLYRQKTARSVVRGLPIAHLILTQTGNVIEVLDSRNIYLKGMVGAPGVVTDADAAGGYPPGADVAQASMTFSGNGIQFVGVVRVISITDIAGVTVTDTHTETEEDSETKTDTKDKTEPDTDVTTTEIPVIDLVTGEEIGTVTQETGHENENTSTKEETETDEKTDTVTTTETTTYTINESSAMYVLEGNWVEGGNVYAVSAMARANAGGFTLTSN